MGPEAAPEREKVAELRTPNVARGLLRSVLAPVARSCHGSQARVPCGQAQVADQQAELQFEEVVIG